MGVQIGLFSTIRQWAMSLPDWRAQLIGLENNPTSHRCEPSQSMQNKLARELPTRPRDLRSEEPVQGRQMFGARPLPHEISHRGVPEDPTRLCNCSLSTVASSHAELRRKLRAARMRTTINDSYCWLDVRELSTERTCVLPAWRAKKSDPLQIYTIGCGALQGTSQADEMCARS